jgi:aspartyl-tRNA(Asn)/glutamyl-tRNA(Gln) amidotransferase subunit C
MINGEDVMKIARLAKLYVDELEIQVLTQDLQEVIKFADSINLAVGDDEVEFDHINDICNAFHDDVVVESYPREEILKNRDGGDDGYFYIKRHSL